MADKLANEIVAASKGEGAAFKKKKIPSRVEANKALRITYIIAFCIKPGIPGFYLPPGYPQGSRPQ